MYVKHLRKATTGFVMPVCTEDFASHRTDFFTGSFFLSKICWHIRILVNSDWTFWPTKMTPPRCLEMLGTKLPVMQQHIPQTSKLNMLWLSQRTRWKSETPSWQVFTFQGSCTQLWITCMRNKTTYLRFFSVAISEVLILGAMDIMAVS